MTGVQTCALPILLRADVTSIVNMFDAPEWGLFTASGAPAFDAGGGGSIFATVASRLFGAGGSSVKELEFRNDNRISNAPQEQGAFVSYNKVASPYNGRVTYIVTGDKATRSNFLRQVAAAIESLELYTLSMPERVQKNCNVVHYDFRRSARGVSQIMVDVWVEEIRIVQAGEFTNTQNPAAAEEQNDGVVQPAPATPQQSASVPGGAPT